MSQPLLSSGQEYLEEQGPDVMVQMNERIDELEAEIRELKADRQAIQREAVVIVLKLLTESLRHVASGKMDIPDVSHAAPSSGSDARWEAIKSRLAPRLRDAVDVLLLQGPMSRAQVAAALKLGYKNCADNVIGVLMRQGIVVETAGPRGPVSLKNL